jgi:hypothetical protein
MTLIPLDKEMPRRHTPPGTPEIARALALATQKATACPPAAYALARHAIPTAAARPGRAATEAAGSGTANTGATAEAGSTNGAGIGLASTRGGITASSPNGLVEGMVPRDRARA